MAANSDGLPATSAGGAEAGGPAEFGSPTRASSIANSKWRANRPPNPVLSITSRPIIVESILATAGIDTLIPSMTNPVPDAVNPGPHGGAGRGWPGWGNAAATSEQAR